MPYKNKTLNSEYQKNYHGKMNRENKKTVIDRYGGKCVCCGETYLEFLTIDHINGNGCRDRLKNGGGGGSKTYKWLIKNNFPPGFRTLCFNCNC